MKVYRNSFSYFRSAFPPKKRTLDRNRKRAPFVVSVGAGPVTSPPRLFVREVLSRRSRRHFAVW